ncbi:MAG TPA: hypothetical protein DCZ48_15160 [Methylococcaceae bacterium]|nr:hypothetical protein [Methylococcaceae bacterium]
MNIEAIYDHGKLSFVTPIRLKHGKVRVIVTVPDDEVEVQDDAYTLPPEVLAMAKAMEEKLDRIRNAPPPADEDLPPLTQKQLDRIEAFALREEVRGLR